MKEEIYLDFASTCPCSVGVKNTVSESLTKIYGNPSSLHKKGEDALSLISNVRKDILKELEASNGDKIIFTSGATESNNIALRGIISKSKKKKILISKIEHPSVYETAKSMEKEGLCNIDFIPVNSSGKIRLEELERLLKKRDVCLISVIYINNVVGVIQDLYSIGRLCKKYNVIFHTDATQGFGKFDISVKKFDIDILSGSAHKIGGPKGIGFLFLSRNIKEFSWLTGGGQEFDLRSGTENVPGIAGFGFALNEIKDVNWKKIKELKNLLIKNLEDIGGKVLFKFGTPNIVSVSFSGIDGKNLVSYLSEKNIFISAGSACDSRKKKEERVLKSLGLTKEEIEGSVRISLSDKTSKKEIYTLVEKIKVFLNIYNG